MLEDNCDNLDYSGIYSSVKATCLPNYTKAKIPITPRLKIYTWRVLLPDYFDTELIDFLDFGWPSGFTAQLTPISATTNHINDQSEIKWVHKFLETELKYKALLSPFQPSRQRV